MIIYNKFFEVLREKGIKQIDLRNKGVHPRTFQKMQRAELIRSDTIDEMCKLLNCQPGDIMAYIPDEATQRQLSTTDTPSTKKESPPPKGKLTPSILLAEDGKRVTSTSPGKDIPIEESDLLPWQED